MVRSAALTVLLLCATAAQADDSAISDSQRAAALKADTRPAVMASVKMLLKDPSSAQFKGIKRQGALSYCGWVNAKNSYGGYEGFAVFYATAKATVLLTPELSEPQLCN